MRTGIIGGSGLYCLDGLEIVEELVVDTPYGPPSDALIFGKLAGQEVVFLSRHGRGHRTPPHRINYRANIYALKQAGVSQIISVSAVGSLREEIAPGHFVIVNQFVDRTNGRPSTFFDGPVVAHVSLADPVCTSLASQLAAACRAADVTVHEGGSALVMQGPQFSTRAESALYRSWGMDVIGMTNMPEAKLAREAELCYAVIAMSTDYDCWHDHAGDVSVASVIEVMEQNIHQVRKVLVCFLANEAAPLPCPAGCPQALDHAILSRLNGLSDDELRPIYPLIKRFL